MNTLSLSTIILSTGIIFPRKTKLNNYYIGTLVPTFYKIPKKNILLPTVNKKLIVLFILLCTMFRK